MLPMHDKEKWLKTQFHQIISLLHCTPNPATSICSESGRQLRISLVSKFGQKDEQEYVSKVTDKSQSNPAKEQSEIYAFKSHKPVEHNMRRLFHIAIN